MNHPVRGVEVQSRVDLSQCLCLQLLRRGCQRQTHLMRTSAPFELEHHPQQPPSEKTIKDWSVALREARANVHVHAQTQSNHGDEPRGRNFY